MTKRLRQRVWAVTATIIRQQEEDSDKGKFLSSRLDSNIGRNLFGGDGYVTSFLYSWWNLAKNMQPLYVNKGELLKKLAHFSSLNLSHVTKFLPFTETQANLLR